MRVLGKADLRLWTAWPGRDQGTGELGPDQRAGREDQTSRPGTGRGWADLEQEVAGAAGRDPRLTGESLSRG